MPKSNDWPLISKYVISSLILSVFNLAACSVCVGIASLDRPENSNPPLFLRWASYHLWNIRCGIFCCCCRRSKTSLNNAKKSTTKASEERDLEVLMVQLPTAERNQGIKFNDNWIQRSILFLLILILLVLQNNFSHSTL